MPETEENSEKKSRWCAIVHKFTWVSGNIQQLPVLDAFPLFTFPFLIFFFRSIDFDFPSFLFPSSIGRWKLDVNCLKIKSLQSRRANNFPSFFFIVNWAKRRRNKTLKAEVEMMSFWKGFDWTVWSIAEKLTFVKKPRLLVNLAFDKVQNFILKVKTYRKVDQKSNEKFLELFQKPINCFETINILSKPFNCFQLQLSSHNFFNCFPIKHDRRKDEGKAKS